METSSFENKVISLQKFPMEIKINGVINTVVM